MRRKKQADIGLEVGQISLAAIGDSMYRLSNSQDFKNWMGLLADRWTKLYDHGKKTQSQEYWFRLDELDETMNLAKRIIEKAKKREEDETDFPTKELEGE